MADDLRKLLMYIVEHPVMQNESMTSQIEATAVRDVPAEIDAVEHDTRTDAERLAPYFERGLRAAKGGRLTVDDTSPEGNLIADAFARYLVAPDLATSQSTDLSDGHFRYVFDVNWQALGSLAQKAGIDLNAALSGSGS